MRPTHDLTTTTVDADASGPVLFRCPSCSYAATTPRLPNGLPDFSERTLLDAGDHSVAHSYASSPADVEVALLEMMLER